MWNTFHLQSSRDPIIYFLFRIENPSYKTDYKPAVSEPMGLHQKIISYLHHRYCHSSALVNQVRSACARLLLMRVAVTTGQCVTTSVPSVPSPSVLLHIHIQPDTMTHIVLNCAADLQSEHSGFSKCWYNWSCEEVWSRHKDGDEYIFFVPSCACNLAIVSVLGMGRYNILNIHLISISLKLNE